MTSAGDILITNCQFIGNSAERGGGVSSLNTSAPIIVTHSTIASNEATGKLGGGLYVDTPTLAVFCDITDNIIYHNTAPVDANYYHAAGSTGLVYSCVYPAVDGTGNITNDPRIVNLADGDYRLRPSSPCVDAGVNLDWMTATTDLDGNPRIRHGNATGTVDMGAYEGIFPYGTLILAR